MNKIPVLHTIVLMACLLQACAIDPAVLIKPQLVKNPAAAPVTQTPGTTTSNRASADLSVFSDTDQVASLRQALTQGAQTAVQNLARTDGFLGNAKVRIPLPDNLKNVDAALRQFGMERYADDLITTMNRAAEAAVPEAQTLLVGAIQNMSVTDAKNILTGNDNAATQYFRTNTETALTAKFKPIVANSMKKVKFAEKYDQFATMGTQLGLVDPNNTNLNDYITRKAMDGLFVMMAEQEKDIRSNPAQAIGSLAKQVLTVLGGQ